MELVSVVGAKLKTTTKGKLMYKYNPTVTELRQAYEVAFGEYGVNILVGTMFANLDQDTIERLYAQALAEVKQDLEEKELI
jgi:hypothetical protein